MPATETPPNPAPPAPSAPPPEPPKVVTRRFGELDHTELVRLLDSLDDDRSKANFRESIYISIIVYLILAWFLVYGPRYIFHQGQIVPTAAAIKAEKDRITQLDLDREMARLKAPPKIAPKLDRRAIEQLQAMQRANEAARAARQPTPQPPAPHPQAPAPAPAAPQQAQAPPPPLPSAPTPQPPPRPAPQVSQIPDAPRPSGPPAPQPQSNLTQSLSDASKSAGQQRPGSRGVTGGYAKVGQQGAGTGPIEILSDTRGVDFTDYIKKLLRMIKAAWLPLIPEECYPPLSKEGWTLIRFSIAKNGALTDPMAMDNSTHDRAIDKAAWGSIVSVGQFPPLPAAYTGDTLELRIQFIISRNAPDTE